MIDNRDLLMPNGASVGDWLGTSAVAAGLAQMYATDVRSGISGAGRLLMARDYARQAADELDEIIARLEQENAS